MCAFGIIGSDRKTGHECMKFTRLGENDIMCVISESELIDYGLDLDDIIEHRGRTKEFFRQVLDMAVRELGMQHRDGLHLASAQISLMKDNSLSIVFHEASIEEILMNLTGDDRAKAEKLRKDIEEAIRTNPKKLTNQIRSRILDALEERLREEGALTPSAEAELNQIRDEIRGDENRQPAWEMKYRVGVIRFQKMDDAIEYCGVMDYQGEVASELYKSRKDGGYYLVMHRNEIEMAVFSRLLYTASEYGSVLDLSDAGRAFLISQSECLIEGDAFRKLKGVAA